MKILNSSLLAALILCAQGVMARQSGCSNALRGAGLPAMVPVVFAPAATLASVSEDQQWGRPDFRAPDDIPVVSGPVLGPGEGGPYPGDASRQSGPGYPWGQPNPPRAEPTFHRAPRVQPRRVRRPTTQRPSITQTLIAICVVVWLGEMLVPGVSDAVVLTPGLGRIEPWRLLTSAFAHSDASLFDGLIHIGCNMFALWVLGPGLEYYLGKARFISLYLLSALGGSVFFVVFAGAANWNVGVVGASGAIFGLFGAQLAIGRHLRANMSALIGTLVLNVAITFGLPGIAWQAHVGGFLIGLLAGWLMVTATRWRNGTKLVWVGLGTILALLVVVVALAYATV